MDDIQSIGYTLQHLPKKELQRRDVFGRTILHLICIVGRFDLLKYLLKNSNLNVFITDYESGWTGLHCSIYYGKLSCARLLLDHKYDLIKSKDRSGLTAMDIYYSKYSYQNLKIFPTSIGDNDTNYIQRFESSENFKLDNDDIIWWDKDMRGGSDVFTFGSNINNQLGTGDSIDKTKVPYKVDIKNFRLNDESLNIADRLVKPRVKNIILSKNHSIILTNEHYNNILISGNPNKGRLGDDLIQNFRFNYISFFHDDHIIDVASCEDHSLALNSNGEVFAWGLNNHYQLGFATEKIKGKLDTYSTEPRRVLHILKKYKIKGISCSKTHSVAFVDNTLILWGLNIGQMSFISTGEQIKFGKYKGIVQIPRDVQFQNKIKQVIATDDSTIVLLENDECHILNNGLQLKYQLPLYNSLNDNFDHFRPSVFSKKKQIIKLVSKHSSQIGILYNDGSVLNFGIDPNLRTSIMKYKPVWEPRNSHLKCIDVDIGDDGSIIICVKSGCVFKRISKSSKSNDYKFTKIEKLSKIVKVSCDSLFTSFGFIRDDIDQLPLELEKNTFYQDIIYLSPLTQAISNKKQSELIDLNKSNLYIIDFLHKPIVDFEDDEYEMFKNDYLNKNEDEEIKDPLLKSYRERWSEPQKITSTSLPPINDEFLDLILSNDLKYKMNTGDYMTGKGYDLTFDIDDCLIGVHSCFLFSVEKFQKLKSSCLIIDDIVFNKVDPNGIIKVENVNIQTILILLHFLYTGIILKPWEKFNKLEIPQSVKISKNQCLKLLENLKIQNGLEMFYGNSKLNIPDFRKFENDLTISLKDGEEIECCSLVLRSRNAYFETLFSDRWDDEDLQILEFNHVDKIVFEVALNYIYGKEQLELWDEYFNIKSIPEFINLQFDLIELSDELLLFDLKNFAQLFIKDFICQDNCLLILHHAEHLNCQKLIGECLWFIYNNVDPLLTDPTYDELLSDQMITRIDKYCRWLNRINKFNIHQTRTAWLDGDSDDLLNKFLNNDLEFKDIFLESDNFVPLFDIKVESPTPTKEPKQKQKSPSPPLAVTMQRKYSSSSQRRPSFNAIESSSSAIEEDEFQPVINSRRRRSSANKRRTSSQNELPSINGFTSIKETLTKSIQIPFKSRNASTSSIGTPKSSDIWPSINSGSPSSSINSFPPISPNLTPAETPSKSTLRNNSNVKLSQKERKRLMKQEILKDESKESESKSSSPWKIPESTIKPLSIAEAQTEALLVQQGVIEPGKFRDYELNPQSIPVTKSFAEIQQEQEFAAWWEEESQKVQNQMKVWENFNNKDKNKNLPKGKKKTFRKKSFVEPISSKSQ